MPNKCGYYKWKKMSGERRSKNICMAVDGQDGLVTAINGE